MKFENVQEPIVPSPIVSAPFNAQDFEGESPNAEKIQEWLIVKFAALLGMPASEIDVHMSLDNYGLGSLQAVSLTGDLEDWLELQLPATLLWDYTSINSLANHLAEQSQVA